MSSKRREKVYGKWMSHKEVRHMMRKADVAAAIGCGLTLWQYRKWLKSPCFKCEYNDERTKCKECNEQGKVFC